MSRSGRHRRCVMHWLTPNYTAGTSWGTGYLGQYTITNDGTTAVTGWTLASSLPSGTSRP